MAWSSLQTTYVDGMFFQAGTRRSDSGGSTRKGRSRAIALFARAGGLMA